MFIKAYEIAREYTKSIVIVYRYFDKKVCGGLGTYVVLNDEGWLMTAAHNFIVAVAFNNHRKEIDDYKDKIKKIESNTKIKQNAKKHILKKIKSNNKWITDFMIILDAKPTQILESHFYGLHDIAFIRVDKDLMKNQKVFPKIINSDLVKPGTSLCKLGFPFTQVKPTFIESKNQFDLPKGLYPLPFFPIDGILTREIIHSEKEDNINIKYIETSSAGLKGQSGGPIFDVKGNLYAVQSKNLTYSLDFKGIIKEKGGEIEENQFMNMGIGVHPETIHHFLNKHKIKFDTVK